MDAYKLFVQRQHLSFWKKSRIAHALLSLLQVMTYEVGIFNVQYQESVALDGWLRSFQANVVGGARTYARVTELLGTMEGYGGVTTLRKPCAIPNKG